MFPLCFATTAPATSTRSLSTGTEREFKRAIKPTRNAQTVQVRISTLAMRVGPMRNFSGFATSQELSLFLPVARHVELNPRRTTSELLVIGTRRAQKHENIIHVLSACHELSI